MKISKNTYTTIHYTLKDDDGSVIDSSVGSEPLSYIHGNGYLIMGLEKELEGKEPGAKFSAIIQPAQGYGEYDERLVAVIDRSRFEEGFPIEVGLQFQAGPSVVRVIKIDGDNITVDGNHELAGKVLHFDIEVVDVRDATEQELAELEAMASGCGGCGGGCGGNCSPENCGGGCGGCSGV